MLSIGRRTRAANLRDRERRVVDGIVELRERAHWLVDIGREGNRGDFARGYADAPDLPVKARDERFRIGREGRSGIDVAIVDAAALRVVALDVHEQPAI